MQADIFLGLKQRLYFPTLHLPYRCVYFPTCGTAAIGTCNPAHAQVTNCVHLSWRHVPVCLHKRYLPVDGCNDTGTQNKW